MLLALFVIACLLKSVERQEMALVGSELVEACCFPVVLCQPAAALFVEEIQ